mmetsp:Transcript_15195/g.26982  ORF Transcript_15195/g.26982 Transcript_15195/m.26982 type:complete len:131 (-) Transcript_15195:1718-2110(-)
MLYCYLLCCGITFVQQSIFYFNSPKLMDTSISIRYQISLHFMIQIGFGTALVRSSALSSAALRSASIALASCVSADQLKKGQVFPKSPGVAKVLSGSGGGRGGGGGEGRSGTLSTSHSLHSANSPTEQEA